MAKIASSKNRIETPRVCFYCKKPGHIIAECRERARTNAGYPRSEPSRPLSNQIINNIITNDSIISHCFINKTPVSFLFDTGSVKTVIAERVNKFEGAVEVIVVKKLVYDYLLGLDVAFRMPEVKNYLVSIRDIFSNTKTPRNTSVLKTQPPLNYSNSLPNISKIESIPRNDTEDENNTRQLDTDELSKIDGFTTILHEEFSDIVAQGLCT
ncbi:hypothetical protein BpHYR1_043553 [Brachionus plicatilis]|uniref:CCHC-type domain-containing protein n=1 Tax=Brachionus plicatilis TaxID=10195 RepID=A0A3M7PWK8_BRAPC|nr:hypothetical protein BpHYR1_043553 [Brachionus plicatilis]